eukprot:scaffold34915_cov58-Phaeocystis_antarctica.AAC.4
MRRRIIATITSAASTSPPGRSPPSLATAPEASATVSAPTPISISPGASTSPGAAVSPSLRCAWPAPRVAPSRASPPRLLAHAVGRTDSHHTTPHRASLALLSFSASPPPARRTPTITGSAAWSEAESTSSSNVAGPGAESMAAAHHSRSPQFVCGGHVHRREEGDRGTLAARQTDRQRNARPKPRTTKAVVWAYTDEARRRRSQGRDKGWVGERSLNRCTFGRSPPLRRARIEWVYRDGEGTAACRNQLTSRPHGKRRGPPLGGFFTVDPDILCGAYALHFCKSSTRCWTVLRSLTSCIRLSNSGWTTCKSEARRRRGRRRPAAGVARRVQRRQWLRRERAADAAT